ncbi:hypothetical protein I6A94_43335 [Frankia sp. CN4]|uniref:Uncharacterized protein n=1 Tax=Frankia nepalensis TaxID=1836974 RepID=A0A937ULK3_9ACTN|nr:hypothetical protein [Frankia nepalensis]MBL7516545.1 hypothetical protein [Frankia nepalensis]MBL7625877.1 hypothetical protein [Frankia nepalensis]
MIYDAYLDATLPAGCKIHTVDLSDDVDAFRRITELDDDTLLEEVGGLEPE